MTTNYQTSIIAAIVGLVFIMGATLIGLGVTGRLDATSTPLVVSIFGTITTTIVALLAVIRSDRTVVEIKRTNGTLVNGNPSSGTTPPTTPTGPA